MTKDLNAYSDWLDRPPAHPNLPAGTWVRALPPELGNGTIIGKVLWRDGSDHSYAVGIPYSADGALLYVHKADVEPLDPQPEGDNE